MTLTYRSKMEAANSADKMRRSIASAYSYLGASTFVFALTESDPIVDGVPFRTGFGIKKGYMLGALSRAGDDPSAAGLGRGADMRASGDAVVIWLPSEYLRFNPKTEVSAADSLIMPG